MQKNIVKKEKSSLRKRVDRIKEFRCKNLIAVLEEPTDLKNIGMVIRNIEALGVEKTYIIDSKNLISDNWQDMREKHSLMSFSASAIKWSFTRKFRSTEECLDYLEKKNFVSMVTSPHIKGRNNTILHEGKYTQKKLAVWFGTESRGISDLAVSRSENCINIEMFGIIESLNLAVSTGIVLYEITKQRREFQKRLKQKKSAKISNSK